MGRLRRNSAALAAARQVKEFGYTGWHLKKSNDYDPAFDGLAGAANSFDRQVVHVNGYATEGFPLREGDVFLMIGEPRPAVGDGLVALTCHWLIEEVSVIESAGDETIYAVLCVSGSRNA